jgi:hypothetical protein
MEKENVSDNIIRLLETSPTILAGADSEAEDHGIMRQLA